ncbi:hypothetical protein R1sor_013405 [Riccia sorocarpa]|uniref:CCHC-type domain-containing protein n=1 Tax=Riccia sorocarpa TaxID=122646 RepID=A0ABD3H8B4_9MARC
MKDMIKMVVPDRIMRQGITYTKLPDTCFICRERGHFARTCPSSQETTEAVKQAFIPTRCHNQPEGDPPLGRTTVPAPANTRRQPTKNTCVDRTDAEGFRRVRSRNSRCFQEPERQVNMKIDSRFEVQQEDEEIEEETGEQEQRNMSQNQQPELFNRGPIPQRPLDRTQQGSQNEAQSSDQTVGSKHTLSSPDRCFSSARNYTPVHSDGRKKLKQGDKDVQSLAQSHPIKVSLQLVENEEGRRRWMSYFKASLEDLEDPDIKQQKEEKWKNHPPIVEDPRIRLDLAWASVNRILKEMRRKKKAVSASGEELLQEFERWRTALLQSNTQEDVSSAFREVNVGHFVATKANEPEEKRRDTLGDITNGHSSRKCNMKTWSPVATRQCSPALHMEKLARYAAEQRARQQNSEHTMDPGGSRLPSERTQNLYPTPVIGQIPTERAPQTLPKVLHRATPTGHGNSKLFTAGPSTAAKDRPEEGLKPATYADKVGQNEGRGLRPMEQRQRPMEAWRAARDRRNKALTHGG